MSLSMSTMGAPFPMGIPLNYRWNYGSIKKRKTNNKSRTKSKYSKKSVRKTKTRKSSRKSTKKTFNYSPFKMYMH